MKIFVITSVLESYSKKVGDCNFVKKTTSAQVFFWEFYKSLRTFISKNTSERLLLNKVGEYVSFIITGHVRLAAINI